MATEACIDWSARVADCHTDYFEAPKDVTIKTVDGEVKAHRLVLAMASPLLMRFFSKARENDRTFKQVIIISIKLTIKASNF